MSQKGDISNQEPSTQWTEIIGLLVENIIGKNMAMTYNFDSLTIDMPRAQGPDGLHLGSVKWTINGKIIIATEAYKKQDVSSDPEKMLSRDRLHINKPHSY